MNRASLMSLVSNSSSTNSRPGSILPVEVFEQSSTTGSWDFRTTGIEEILGDTRHTPTFVFADSDALRTGHNQRSLDLRVKLEDYYGMPSFVWSNTQWESNGFFGCTGDERTRHNTWFRFLVKMVLQTNEKRAGLVTSKRSGYPEYTYGWLKMGFFSSWSLNGRRSVLCLDCPPELKAHIRKSLDVPDNESFSVDPYCFHTHILGGIVDIVDSSIWLIRDLIRNTEKGRLEVGLNLADIDYLHELSRHVIHSSETSAVTTEVMSKIVHRHGIFASRANIFTEQEKGCVLRVDGNLDYYSGLVNGFKSRCDSMQQRHEGEIAYAQFRAVAADSAAMKEIAAITMAFLPATFVSAIFSMSFFDQGENWGLSSKFWIYWVFAIPITIVTMILLRRWSSSTRW